MRDELTLGIELGSTRIKAVLIDSAARVLAVGGFGWENRLLPGGVWSYRLKDALKGVRTAYAELKADYRRKTGRVITRLDAIGISGMMHGYLPFDAAGRQLAEFRTWRCTVTAEASERLSKAFDFTMPQRWSVTHLYQRMLERGDEVKDVAFLTTLAGYVHFLLTGERVVGVGEASGMFPIDPATADYDARRVKTFERLAARAGYALKLGDILPRPLPAGACGGRLTSAGAKLLDPSGDLEPGAFAAPPEGDVQTGMVATNSVARGTVNVSAGTSAFAIAVLERPLAKRNADIDIAVSPTGVPIAMSHANTCTSDLNAWAALFGGDFDALFHEAAAGEPDCGGVVTVPYLSGETVTQVAEGHPLVVRRPDAHFTRANFLRANLYSAFATLRLALDILFAQGVRIKGVIAHGGLFKTPKVAQQILADALNAPVTCLSTAGEGGAWGMAVLAAFGARGTARRARGETLEAYLGKVVFKGAKGITLKPAKTGVKGFSTYLADFVRALAAERALSVGWTDERQG